MGAVAIRGYTQNIVEFNSNVILYLVYLILIGTALLFLRKRV